MKISGLVMGIAAALCLAAIISQADVGERLQQAADALAGKQPEFVGTQCEGTDNRPLYGETFRDLLQLCKDVERI
jgi:hypothetical protein